MGYTLPTRSLGAKGGMFELQLSGPQQLHHIDILCTTCCFHIFQMQPFNCPFYYFLHAGNPLEHHYYNEKLHFCEGKKTEELKE